VKDYCLVKIKATIVSNRAKKKSYPKALNLHNTKPLQRDCGCPPRFDLCSLEIDAVVYNPLISSAAETSDRFPPKLLAFSCYYSLFIVYFAKAKGIFFLIFCLPLWAASISICHPLLPKPHLFLHGLLVKTS
jgi:hypothetical protein